MSHPAPYLLAAHGLGYWLSEGRALFSGLTLAFCRERTAVVGPNGSGKSTLLRVLAGELAPTEGGIVRHGHLGYLPQRPPTSPTDRVVELLGVGSAWDALHRLLEGRGDAGDTERVDAGWDLPERVERTLASLGLAGLSPERSAASLSGGEATRVALGGLLLRDPSLLLLDEPTNHLDRSARAAFFDWLQEWSGGLVVASHDRELLRRVHRVIELGTGAHPYLVSGSFDEWREQRRLREEAAARDLEVARIERRKVRREAQRVRERQERRKGSGAARAREGGVPKILLGAQKRRAQTTTGRLKAQGDTKVEAAEARVREAAERVVERRRIKVPLSSTGLPAGREVVRARGLAVRGLFGPLDLTWQGPVRIALTGDNGTGKSTLLRIVATAGGLNVSARRFAGEVRVSLPTRGIALLEQWLPPWEGRSVMEHLRRLHPDVDDTRLRQVLDRFLFRHAGADAPLSGLSEGERTRVALAGILAGPHVPSLLLLDEPANHLDLEAVEAMEALLGEYDGALVVASHDQTFLEGIGCAQELRLGRSG